MKRDFTSTSVATRAVFVVAAILAAALIIGGIDGLAAVYASGGQLALVAGSAGLA